jgi:ferredoxin
MGIDVRSYAEKEKTLFVPPVGCGICAAVCPRSIEMKMTRRPINSNEILLGNDVNWIY